MSEPRPLRPGLFRGEGKRAVLLASRCHDCHKTHFPQTQICLHCLGSTLDEVELPRVGTLFSYTTVHMRSANFASGHTVGYVDLSGAARVFGPLRFPEGSVPRVGQQLSVEMAPLWTDADGVAVVGYQFTPAETQGDHHA